VKPPGLNKTDPIFLSGHRGLLGSAFLRRLNGDGSNIIVRKRDELDLQDQAVVEAFFDEQRPKLVIMAAGLVGGIIYNRDYPADFILENLAMQLNTMKAARRTGVEKFLFFGSSCMYPKDCPQPMSEEMLLAGKPEETSMPYAIAKLAGVQTCLAINRQDKAARFLPVIPNTIYGPNDNFNPETAHVIPALIRRFHEAKISDSKSITLWGSGSPRRESIYADDLVDACMQLLEADTEQIEFPLNIGTGRDYEIREIADIIKKVVGYRGKIEWDRSKPDGSPRKLLDSSKMVESGWRPKIELDEGIKRTYDWFLKEALIEAA